MVDGVSYNPFSGKVFTADEITHLDLDKDGKISQSELEQGMSWLAGGQDVEGDVQIGSEDDLFRRAKNAGVGDKATTQAEFKSAMSTVIDEFQEMYFTQNTDLTDSERQAMQNLIAKTGNAFIVEYMAANPKGPWDIKAAASAFMQKMEEAIVKNKQTRSTVDAQMAGYTNNMDANLERLTNLSAAATENGNVSQSEFNQMKNVAAQYIMGMLMSGEIDEMFFLEMTPKYKSNNYYNAAMRAIKNLQNCDDPEKMQEYITEAMNNINRFIEACGAKKFANAVNAYSEGKQKEEIKAVLDDVADKYKESHINASMSDADKQYISTFVDNCVEKFIAKLMESGDFKTLTPDQIKSQFNTYLYEQYSQLKSTQAIVTRSAGEVENKHDVLVKHSDSAAQNGNISDAEKAQIIKAANEFIVSQLLNGMDDIELLKSLNKNYKTTAEFKEIQSLVSQIKTSTDPEEVKELEAKIAELLTKMLEKYSGDALVKAVDSTKPVEVSNADKNKAVFDSSISADYSAGATRGTSRGKQNEDRLKEIQEMAKQDMLAVAEQLKAQLKAKLGSAYNEAEVEKYIQDAINDTIAQFTEGITRRNCHGNYTSATNKYSFEFLDRTNTSKGRYCYNVQALIDTFVKNFNECAKNKNEAKLDPNQANYDKENVIADSLGNEYLRAENIEEKGTSAQVRANLLNQAKAKLMQVAAALKASLLAEGCVLGSADIDELIDMAMKNTLDINKVLSNTSHSSGLFGWGSTDYTKFNVKDLTDRFFKEFDKLYEKKMQEKNR